VGFTSISAQHKWDIDSIYLAEFGSDTLVLPDIEPFAVQVSPLRALYGSVGADVEALLTQNKSILFGINHVLMKKERFSFSRIMVILQQRLNL